MRSEPALQLRHALATALAVGSLAAVGAAGCGGSSSPSSNGVGAKAPAQIVAAAASAATGAATVRVMGSIVDEGKPISLDVELVADKGGAGRLVVDGRVLNVVQVDNDMYINASESFYEGVVGPRVAHVLAGRWLKASDASGDLAPLAALTSLNSVVHLALGDHGLLTHAPSAVIDGKPAVGVTDAAAGGTLYVASTGVPYPIRVSKHDSRVTFDRWNKPVTLTVPAGAVNVKQVQRGRR